MMISFRSIILFLLFLPLYGLYAQQLEISGPNTFSVQGFTSHDKTRYHLYNKVPVFSVIVDGTIHSSEQARLELGQDGPYLNFNERFRIRFLEHNQSLYPGKYSFTLFNLTADTLDVENFVPFGQSPDHVYLTSTGPWALARAKLFIPGQGPVGVILPDNAWELGYGAIKVDDTTNLCALARRTKTEKAESRRYRTLVYTGGYVEYEMWVEEYSGEWQNGLKLMFRDKYLFDLTVFDDSLYRRNDLKWIRHAYLIGLQFAWNAEFYSYPRQEYTVDAYLERGIQTFGGYDVIGLWPTWPRLGVDPRNQWDMFSDMPGSLMQLKKLSEKWKQQGTRFFICYNPWDESTRSENPYAGLANLIRETDADGVVLDCHGASSYALQHAADSVKAGVVMYSEGMAIVKDMPGIVAGRVHDAIVLPPPLNLNKLIKPDFAIFRVCQLHDGRIRREASIALFNGYGTELNSFAPGRPDSMEEDLVYLGKTTRILRENTSNFLSYNWTPLIPTVKDSIWVNKWPLGQKTIYTVFSLVPEGFQGPLFEENKAEGMHLVSLWHHEELTWSDAESGSYIPAKVEAFNAFELGTRAEGNIDCIALLPDLINASLREGYLSVDLIENTGDEIRIWAGDPSYQNKQFTILSATNQNINVMEMFGWYEGKFVIQLFKDGELLDERVVMLEPGTPIKITPKETTAPSSKTPEGMVLIPAGLFDFMAENTDQFIPYPDTREPVSIEIQSFYMDKYPVTNAQYLEFLTSSGYHPEDPVNFLKHWIDGKIPEGLEDHPVVFVSPDDAKAYAVWAGKRLPTEVEWQYAAGGSKGYKWPWGNEFDSLKCNYATGLTTPVSQFTKGKSPFGVQDLVGNVWQLTSDIYFNGTYYFVIMKGGSCYRPTSSWWYVKGGPQAINWHQQLLLVSPSFDRNATVGFRCVKDIMP